MIIGSISENKDLENRISITPDLIKKYVSQGFKVLIEKDYGNHLGFSDKEYQEMLFGDIASSYMSRAFYSNGDNKRTWVQNFQNMLTTPQGKANFMNYKRVIISKRKKEKFESLVQAGAYTSELEGKPNSKETLSLKGL